MWRYHNPVEIAFGAGIAAERAAARIGKRPWALVTYAMPMFAAKAAEIAAMAGPPVATIDNIQTNPDMADLVRSCAALAEAPRRAEAIVALGGGSIIDAAKVLAAGAGDFERVRRNLVEGAALDPAAMLPLIAIPSTAGTGSEVTCWATVWDAKAARKYSLAHPKLYPELAIVDPDLTLAAPSGLTLATGLDALSHALESIWNIGANPVSADFAVAAAREILEVLPALAKDLGNRNLRARMAAAALRAGLAFSNTRTALAHNISYDVTLRRGTPHGIACSFSLPAVMEWSIGCDARCDADLARIFGPDLAAGARRLRDFLEGLGVSTSPAAYGFDEAQWKDLVSRAAQGERGRNFIGRRNLAA
jgi:alcohol dehydrogenase